jgi:hypothetical protein
VDQVILHQLVQLKEQLGEQVQVVHPMVMVVEEVVEYPLEQLLFQMQVVTVEPELV